MFLPTDDAFAKLPVDKQMALDNNSTKLTQVLFFVWVIRSLSGPVVKSLTLLTRGRRFQAGR